MNRILQTLSTRDVGPEFPPDHLEILNFYGSEAVFTWREEKLLIYPYNPETPDEDVQIIESGPLISQRLSVPLPIKTICSYSGRVFIICEPSGIYKLSDKYTFAVLSRTGIGLGCEVHQVLTPTRGWLYLADKITKRSKPLFQLFKNIDYREENGVTVYDIRQILFCGAGNCDKFCLITSGKKLYKLIGEEVSIVHVEGDIISDIVAIQRDREDFGVGLITEGSQLILLLPEENTKKLVPVRKLRYDGHIVALALHLPTSSRDELWSFHTNGHSVYRRKIDTESSGRDRDENIEVVFTSNESIINSMRTRGNRVLVLSNGELIELEIARMEEREERKEFSPLQEDMIKNTKIIVDRICERAQELEMVNRGLAGAQSRLERINAYAHRQKTQYIPEVRIARAGGKDHLEIKLEGLPQDSQVFVNVLIDQQRLFTSKVVCDRVTTLEIPLDIRDLGKVEKFDVRIDLVTTQCENQLWCILNNYDVDCGKALGRTSGRIATDRENLLTAKMATLRSLIEKNSLDEVKLGYIKKSIRN